LSLSKNLGVSFQNKLKNLKNLARISHNLTRIYPEEYKQHILEKNYRVGIGIGVFCTKPLATILVSHGCQE
jgi:hypothetical protein